MPVRLSDLPPKAGTPTRAKPSRTEAGKPTVGRCIPHTGTCTWTGPYGAAFERHTRQTGHHRLELIDAEDHTDG